MSSSTAPVGPVLLTQAQELLRRLDELASRHGREEVIGDIRTKPAASANAMLRIVLCGETGRGKSTLANALVDRPGLLPAERDVPTAVHVLIRQRGSAEREAARVHTGPGDSFEVPLEEMQPFILEPQARERHIRLVEVTLDHPLLARGVGLVDTPGVGGLQRAHGRVARAALTGADAAVLVVDASEKLNAMELAFLGTAVEAVDVAVVALNKIDDHSGWPVIRAEDAALIASAKLNGASPAVVPLSARLKCRGDRMAARGGADAEHGAGLARDSGVPELRARLMTWAEHRSGALVAARLCRLGLRGLAHVRAFDDAVLSAPEAGTRPHAERAQASRESRRRLTEAQRGLARRLQNVRQLLGYELDASINRRLSDVGSEFTRRVTAGEDDDLEAELEAALSAALDGIVAELGERLDTAAQELAAALEEHGADLDLDDVGLPAAVRPAVTVAELPPRPKTISVMGMLARGGGAAGTALMNPIFGVSLLAGMLVETGFRIRQAKGQQLAQQVSETIARARLETTFALRQALLAGQELLTEAFDDAIRRRVLELDESIKAQEAQAKASQEQRERAVAGARQRAKELDALGAALAELRRSALAAAGGVATRVPAP